MTAEEGLEFLEQILVSESLNKVQQIIFQQTWEGRSYKEIADTSGYTLGYIKDTGSKLWRLLSEQLGEKITRHNFQVVLKRAMRQRSEPTFQNSLQNQEEKVEKADSSTIEVQNFFTAFTCEEGKASWGEAIDVSLFYNRTTELVTLEQWLQERCRLVAILGMGGMGKTALSVKLAEQVQDDFEYLIWRSLRHAPSLQELIAHLIVFLSKQQEVKLPESIEGQITCLMTYLRQHRCLLVLDNIESILQSGERTGRYRAGYEGYGQLIARISDERHQSCLVLTSREKPTEVSIREGDTLPVRSLQLTGLSTAEGQKLLHEKGLIESETNCHHLIQHYGGNPLALKIAASTIRSLFNSKIETFLNQGTVIFGDISELLDQQFNRLSDLEQQVMNWLAISREWVTCEELQADLVPNVSQRELLEALASLQARSLIETNALGFSQQPVVMEYMTERLVKQFYNDISALELAFFNRYPLLKAQAKDYIREAQIHFILRPIQEKLLAAFEDQENLENHLNHLLKILQKQSYGSGYAAGNLLNLFWQLQSHLCDRNFSHLTIRQAYLPNLTLHRANFSHCTITQSVFAETFGGIVSVAFSPDGKRLATSDTSGEIQIWEVPTGKQLVICKGHQHWTWAITFSSDGHYLASASDDYLVKLWDSHTGECLQTFVGHTYSVNAIAFSPDGHSIATSSQDATIRIWACNSANGCIELSGHQGRVWSVAFSPDGKMLASCSEDQTIKLWDWRTGHCLKTLTGHAGWVKAIAFSPNGNYIASGSFDQTIKIWQAETGDCLKTFYGHSSVITSVTFSPDGRSLASSSYDRTIRLWDVKTATCLRTFQGHGNRVWSVAFSPAGQWLASGGDDHAAKLWDIRTGQCIKTIKGHTNSVLAIDLSADEHHLAGGYEDQTIRLWDIETQQCVQTLYGHSNRVWSVAFCPHNETAQDDAITLASGSADRTIKLWNWETGRCLKTLQGHDSWVWSVAFHPKGERLASGSYDRTIKLWDLDAGKCQQTLEAHTAPVVSVAFSPNGAWLASGSYDATIKLWNVQTGDCLNTFQGHSNSIWQVQFSPDGQYLVSCSFDQTIKLWDISTGDCIQTFAGHTGAVTTVSYRPDNQSLISGSMDQTVRLWDISSGDCLQVLQGHTGIVSRVVCQTMATSPHPPQTSELLLFSGGFDETIKYWNPETRSCLATLRVPRPYEGMNIHHTRGLNDAQRTTLRTLGAIDAQC